MWGELVCVFSGLAIAILVWFAVVVFLPWRRIRRRRAHFWANQSKECLAKVGLLSDQAVLTPPETLAEWEATRMLSQVVALAQETGLLDFLAQDGGADLDAIAGFLRAERRWCGAALELLWASGIVSRRNGVFVLAPESKLYLSSFSPIGYRFPPSTLRRVLRRTKGGGATTRWRQGRTVRPEGWAVPQHRQSLPLGFALAKAGFLEGARSLLDVAGGVGSFSIALALVLPELEIGMIELPGMARLARRMTDQYGLADRIRIYPMNMFDEAWPKGADRISFVNVFHDWSDENCLLLARKAFETLPRGGRILVVEALLNEDGPGPLWTAYWGLSTALYTEGRQFRPSELTGLLLNAGFAEPQIVPLTRYYSVAVASKPN